jgi:acyl-CoA thioesterase FadM
MARCYTYERLVTWADCDATGMWRFTSALTFVEEAEVSLLRDAGVLALLYGRLPRAYVEARFAAAAAFDDLATVHLSIARIGRTSLHYEFDIRLSQARAASGKLGAVFVDEHGKPEALAGYPRDLLERWMAAAPLRST